MANDWEESKHPRADDGRFGSGGGGGKKGAADEVREQARAARGGGKSGGKERREKLHRHRQKLQAAKAAFASSLEDAADVEKELTGDFEKRTTGLAFKGKAVDRVVNLLAVVGMGDQKYGRGGSLATKDHTEQLADLRKLDQAATDALASYQKPKGGDEAEDYEKVQAVLRKAQGVARKGMALYRAVGETRRAARKDLDGTGGKGSTGEFPQLKGPIAPAERAAKPTPAAPSPTPAAKAPSSPAARSPKEEPLAALARRYGVDYEQLDQLAADLPGQIDAAKGAAKKPLQTKLQTVKGILRDRDALRREQATNHSEGSRLSRVQVFAAGTHRDKPYTDDDLDDMVRNFRESSVGQNPRLRVPAVLGHEERQELLSRSDIPAAAWATDLYREGHHLYADFEDVPEQVARLIRGRRYRKVSAEVYDRPPAGVEGRGKMLRRVAFLGGDIPQVKSLEDIPMPEPHSERGPLAPGGRGVAVSGLLKMIDIRKGPEGLYQVFSEVQAMDRQAMLEALGKHGIDVSGITDAVPDPVIAEILRALEAKGSEQKPAPMEEPQDWPEPKDDAEKMAYRERCKKYTEHAKKMAAKYGEEEGEEKPFPPKKDEKKGDEETPMKMSEVQALVAKAVKDALAQETKGSLSELQKYTEEIRSAEKKRSVDALVDRLGREGKLPPSEKDAVHARLLRADSRTAVSKFSEGGKTVDATEFDLQVRELERRPTLFGERFKDPAGGAGDDEKAVIEKFAEANATSFAKAGLDPKEFVSTWQKSSPEDRAHTLEEARRFFGGR